MRNAVRRIGKGPRGRVVAFQDELQCWLRNNAKATTKVGLASIIDSLTQASSSAKQICGQCHSPMKFLDGHFWDLRDHQKVEFIAAFLPSVRRGSVGKSLSLAAHPLTH
jgi:hypothetical protein